MLFDKEQLPRSAPLKRMHVVDAGSMPGGKAIRFKCSRCGHDTGWIADEKSISENKRGRPCPSCN